MTQPLELAEVQRVAQSLRYADPATRADLIANEVIETGGTYIEPKGDCTHVFELHLHGILARGLTEAEAIANWLTQATRIIESATAAPLTMGAQQ